MGEIKLNKPLYEEGASGSGVGSAGAGESRSPRPPRPHTLARVGALVVDVLVLHFVGTLVIRLSPEAVLALGPWAPWVGLAIGWLYFGVAASAWTGGRSVGKLILQVRVADATGPDLSLGRALVRSAVLLWPLVLFLVVDRLAETLDRPDTLSLAPLWPRVAGAVAFGWWLGNVFFVALDAAGRATWDWAARSVVITSDCEAAALGEFMRGVRQGLEVGPSRRSWVALAITLAACGGLFGWLLAHEQQRLRTLPAAERQRIIAQKQKLYVPGFGQPMPLGPSASSEPEDAQTSTAHFQYRRRGSVERVRIEKDPVAMGKAEELARVSVEEMRRLVAERDVPREVLPEKVRFDVGFAQYCDLLFAWDAIEVVKVSHTVALRQALSRGQEETTSPAGRADLEGLTGREERGAKPWQVTGETTTSRSAAESSASVEQPGRGF